MDMKRRGPPKGYGKGKPSTLSGKGKALAWLKAHVGHQGEECLIWPFHRIETGYGTLGYHGKVSKAHRIMCKLAHGEPPEPRYHAAHSCHRGHHGCVNPLHLSWKTPSQNTLEAVEQNGGVIGGYRRLTIDQVEAIRRSDKRHGDLAAEYGVAKNTIGKIMRGEIWVKPRSKLTRDQILQIKTLDAWGSGPTDIARQVGVRYETVRKMVSSQNFRDIE